MDDIGLCDSFGLLMFIWAFITLYIWVVQDLDGDFKQHQRDVFYRRHWEEAEKFIETELNRMGINTVSDLEENEDE